MSVKVKLFSIFAFMILMVANAYAVKTVEIVSNNNSQLYVIGSIDQNSCKPYSDQIEKIVENFPEQGPVNYYPNYRFRCNDGSNNLITITIVAKNKYCIVNFKTKEDWFSTTVSYDVGNNCRDFLLLKESSSKQNNTKTDYWYTLELNN